ncbi:MAG: MBL fold metallo-hydrolase [Candidatus Omnitrophica bacterium]|nr:MBL fold metallo-hydrolase [Candidatus Omnitrophota bacterium]
MKFSFRIILILSLINLLVWGVFLWPRTPTIVVTFFDVGQGDSAFITFPQGGNMLIDGGPGGEYNRGERVILPYLRKKGIRRIDAVALTHPHADHLGGLIPVMEKMKIGIVIDSGAPHTSFLYRQFLELVDKKDIPFYIAHEGDEVTGFKDIKILILNPPLKPFTGTDSDLNNNSLVMKIIFNQVDFLFCADIQLEAEEKLTGYGTLLASKIIKVPHHGSSTSIYDQFLNLVSPQEGIISCGYKNQYKYPHSRTLKAYKKLNTKIYRTDRTGAIIVTSDGKSYRMLTKDMLM